MGETTALALIPTSELRAMAETVAKSGLFAAAATPEKAFALMLLCQAEGLHPMQAVRRFHIIKGQPSMRSDAMLAEFQARGGRCEWKERSATAVEAVFTAPTQEGPLTIRWTIADAKLAGLLGNETWTKYPKAMLTARVISEGVRVAMPGVVVGLYTPEEVEDLDDKKGAKRAPAPKAEPEPIDVQTLPAEPEWMSGHPPVAPVAEKTVAQDLYVPPAKVEPLPPVDPAVAAALPRMAVAQMLEHLFPGKSAAQKAKRLLHCQHALGRLHVAFGSLTDHECALILGADMAPDGWQPPREPGADDVEAA